MSKTVQSLRGEQVNFDLFAIKAQMNAAPKGDNVVKRERFVNKKRRRSIANKLDKMAQAKAQEDKNFDAKLEVEGSLVIESEATEVELPVEASEEAASPTPRRTRRVVGP